MTFSEIVDQASALLQRKQRITYRTLKREFNLDEEALEDLKCELIDGQRLAADEDGKVVVLVGEGGKGETGKRGNGEGEVVSSQLPVVIPLTPAGERRQLT